jgi:hypothetical protein
MDTVWTTVKVRRGVLADAAASLPGLSNSALVQAGLERLLDSTPVPVVADRPSVPQRAPVVQRAIPGQSTVEEMLVSCPQCAGELEPVHGLQNGSSVDRCEDCGWIREPTGKEAS